MPRLIYGVAKLVHDVGWASRGHVVISYLFTEELTARPKIESTYGVT